MYNETQMFPSACPTTLAYEMSKETPLRPLTT